MAVAAIDNSQLPDGFTLDAPAQPKRQARSGGPAGLVQPGNVNLTGRPVLHNADGTISSEKSFSIGTDKGETLLPLIVNGKELTQQQAIDHYRQTGEHMGIFDTPENADAYATQVHNRPLTQAGNPVYVYQGKAATNPALPDGFTLDEAQQSGPRQLPPMTKANADSYLQTLAAGGTKPHLLPQQPSFANTAYVDPNSSVFGEPIKSSVHPDSRGGRNLVPIQDVAATRQQMQYDANNPDVAARIQRGQQMDTSLPLAQRLAARQGLQARTRAEFGQAVSNANDQYLNYVGNKGADVGEGFAQFMARNFQTENPQATPGEIGAARSVGRNVARTVADPTTSAALLAGGVGGKVGQVAISSLFAAGAAKGSYDAAGQLGSIWDRPDISSQQKAEMATDLVLNTAMAGMAGGHAVKAGFLTPSDPMLSGLSPEAKFAITRRVNDALGKTGGVLSRTASTAGDVMAEVANSDREGMDTPDPRQTVTQRVVDAAPKVGVKLSTADNALQAIKQARADTLAHHEHLAGGNLGDIAPDQADSMHTELDLLNTMEQHIQAGRDQALANAKKPAQMTRPQALMEALKGGGTALLGHGAATAAESMGFPGAHLFLELAGLSGGAPKMVQGIKGILAKRVITPDLHNAMVEKSFGGMQPSTQPDIFGADVPTGPDPFATQPFAPTADNSVSNSTSIFPPERAGGDARVFPAGGTVPSDFSLGVNRSAEQGQLPLTPLVNSLSIEGIQNAARNAAEVQRQAAVAKATENQRMAQKFMNGGKPVVSASAPATPQTGDIFPNDEAMHDWLNRQEQNNPALQRIKDLANERIRKGDLPPGIRPSDSDLSQMERQVQRAIQEANSQGIDTPAMLDIADQWTRKTNVQPKPFQAGRPLKTSQPPMEAGDLLAGLKSMLDKKNSQGAPAPAVAAQQQGASMDSIRQALAKPVDPTGASAAHLSQLRGELVRATDPAERASIQQAIDHLQAVQAGQPFKVPEQAAVEGLPASQPRDIEPGVYNRETKTTTPTGNNIIRANSPTIPAAQLQPGDTAFVNPKDVKLDPARFQFKHNINERGVTNQFADVNKFDEGLAGVVDAFKDPSTGELYAVNGHHRTVLAQDLNAPRMKVNVMDTQDATEARARGAAKNLAEGRGTGFDAAVFLRDSGLMPSDLGNMGISLSDAKVNTALALKNLSPEILDKVGNGTLDEGRAVAIGQATDNPDLQRQIINLVQNKEKSGKHIPNDVVSSLAKHVVNAPNYETQTQGLFGMQSETRSLAIEKAQVDAGILRNLRGEKAAFGAVKSQARADQLSRAGNVIKPEENRAISDRATQAIELYNRLSQRAGPVNKAVETAAMEISLGQETKATIDRATAEIRQILESEIGGGQPGSATGENPLTTPR